MAALSTETPAEVPDATPGGRRFLISAAVTDVRALPEAERPELADDVRRIDGLFLDELGYRRGADLALNPTKTQLLEALREFATAPDRRPDDYVVLYIAAHGVTAEHSRYHYLLLNDSDPRDLRRTALRTEDLVAEMWDETAVERLLVLIDACYAEEGAERALRDALDARRFKEPVTEHGGGGLALIAASRRKEEAYAGALSAAFARAVRRQAIAGNAPAHISLDLVMAAISVDPEVPAAQRPMRLMVDAGGLAFLPNPRYIPDSADKKLDEIDRIVALGSHERTAREQDMRTFFLPRARGTDVPTEDVWDFTGRHTALGAITAWLAPERADERLCVVTGDPGSGKSAVLGLVAALTDPRLAASVPRAALPCALPPPGAVDARRNASHLSTRQLLDALSAAAGCAAESLGALTAHLQTRTRPLVFLIDSLDEALAPQETVDELITPLTDPERQLPLRLLVGARPHVAARLPATAPRIDLDSEDYADPAAVRHYVRKLLSAPASVLAPTGPGLVGAVADAVAQAAGRSFLVARITARTIAREPRPPNPYDQRWRDELPRLPGEAMERDLVQRLGDDASRARDLLRPLAYAQGSGLPWAGVWPRLASALTGRDYGDQDIVWLREAAGSYVVESVEDEGSVYRVYHRALIEYLREGRDAEVVQRTVTEVLRHLDHPYVRRYLPLHAGEGGVLDPLVQSARFVLTSEPAQLLAALPRLRTPEGNRAGRALRDMEEELRHRGGRGDDPEGRAGLRLAAVCRRAQALADSCDEGEGKLPWRARWAAWNPDQGARRYAGMGLGTRRAVVAPEMHGARYLDCWHWDEVRWWDLDSGADTTVPDGPGTGESLSALTAPAQLPGTAAALTYGRQMAIDGRYLEPTTYVRLLHLWDERRSTWLLPPHPKFDIDPTRRAVRHAEQVLVLADDTGRPAAAVLRFEDGHLLVYLLSSHLVYPPLTRRQRKALWEYAVKTWGDMADQMGAVPHRLVEPADPDTRITACAAPAALPTMSLLLGHADGRVSRWDAEAGRTQAETRTGHVGAVTHIDLVIGHPQGRLLVTAGDDGTVRLSSLSDGEPVRTLHKGAFPVASLAVRRVGRQWLVAVATADGQLRRIDLDSGRPIGLPLRVDRGASVRVATFELGTIPCVSVQGGRRGLQLYDLVTGDRVGGQDLSHSATALCTVDGMVCVGGSDGVVRFWPTSHAADRTQAIAHERQVLALAEIRGPSGAPALVTVGQDYEIRCWEPGSRHELWHRRILDHGRWEVPLIGCATTGRTSEGRDFVATGEYGGRVRVLVLRDGLPTQEQEFDVPDVVTALTAGRVRGRDVLVVGTGSGRLACWDVGTGRMYALGPPPDVPMWTTCLALAPDGSGRLAVGGFEGNVREWSLPECRPLGPSRPAHRGRVCALSYVGGRLVGSGSDHRLVCYADGWERRMPDPVSTFHSAEPGPLCGDESGHVWQLSEGSDGWHVAEVLDAVRTVTAVASVSVDGRSAVAVGCPDGSLHMRDAERGTLVRRLRPVGEQSVDELVTVAWRSPDRQPRPLLFARDGWGLLEYWDFGTGGTVQAAGAPLATPVPQQREGARLAVLPDGAGGQRLLSLVERAGRIAVHDVAEGPLLDLPCRPPGEEGPHGPLCAVRCGGRTLVFVPFRVTEPTDGLVIRVLDTETLRWAELNSDDYLVDVFPLRRGGRDELLVISVRRTRVYTWAALENRFDRSGRPPTRQGRSWRRSTTHPPPAHEHGSALRGHHVRHAVLLPGGETYAVAGDTRLAVVGVRDGLVRSELRLPAMCTALGTGPDGELIVGTSNGTILFD